MNPNSGWYVVSAWSLRFELSIKRTNANPHVLLAICSCRSDEARRLLLEMLDEATQADQ